MTPASQIRLLGESVQARARGEDVPEGGYQGDYVLELADQIPGVAEMATAEASRHAVELLLAQIKGTLDRYGVHFDRFFSERTLHEGSPSYVDRALELVGNDGYTYRSDGALWLRTTTFGDDKDRVLMRSDGAPTYFAADLAYLLEKRERGVELQLLPVGSDHHGYVARIKAADAALGGDPDQVEMPIIQFVHLIEGDQRAAMSKRRGDFITLDDLIDEIGVDATRFFMLQRSHDRTVDLDVDLARRESAENPVYYVQYAHARIVTMLGKAGESQVARALAHGRRLGLEPARAGRAGPREGAGGVPRRGRRGRRPAGAAPDRLLRARTRAGVHGLLPRLQGDRRSARTGRVIPDRALPERPAGDRAGARAARGPGAGRDVGAPPKCGARGPPRGGAHPQGPALEQSRAARTRPRATAGATSGS